MQNYINHLNITIPRTEEDWKAYHQISKNEVFVNIPSVTYDITHPCFSSPFYHHFIAQLAEKIVGMMQLEQLKNNEWALRIIAIDKSYQKRNIGANLIAFAKSFCYQQGGIKIRTHANNKAIGFYQQMGFYEDKWQNTSVNEGTKDFAFDLV